MIHAKPHAPAYERAPVHLTRLQVLILFLSPLALIFLIAFARSSSFRVSVMDNLRASLGPRPVAVMEEIAQEMSDWQASLNYHLAGPPAPYWRPAPPGFNLLIGNGWRPADLVGLPNSALYPSDGQWQALRSMGVPPMQSPILYRTQLHPDPERPYAQVAVVIMDMNRAMLHLVAGTEQPESELLVSRPGQVDLSLQSHLLAAFNSGLPSIYGDFGLANRQGTFVPPTPGLATVALYRDRRVRIGIWGRDLRPAPDLVALRQNCLLLVDRGQLDAREEEYDLEPASPYCRRRPTWRSGIGITAEGRLLYAAGNALTLRTLGQALRLAGAQQAMQLDIGRDFIRFDTFTDRPGLLPNAHNLIRAMIGDDNDYLRPEKRDFFYLTYSTH